MLTIDDGVLRYLEDVELSTESFVVVTDADPVALATALARLCDRFSMVGESGDEWADIDELYAAAARGDYGPSYVSDPEHEHDGWHVYVDCKGVITDEQGVTFRRILTEELGPLGDVRVMAEPIEE